MTNTQFKGKKNHKCNCILVYFKLEIEIEFEIRHDAE